MGDEAVHFHLNQSLKQFDDDNADCNSVEQIVPISTELIYDCKIQNSMNENETNFQYIEAHNVEYLNSNFEFKTTLSIKEICTEKSNSKEEDEQGVEKSFEGLILKKLPKHLKYAFLGAERAQPVIIGTDLTKEKELKLLKILIKYKEAIALSVEDLIQIINPSICMHKILLEENAKTSIEHQRRLNPMMKEVVKNEVLKWLNAGFIYAISDSPSLGKPNSCGSKKGWIHCHKK